MRRAAVFAIIFVMALGGVAQAGGPVAKVTGTYTYLIWGDENNARDVSVTAHGTDPVGGTWSWTQVPSGWYLSGPLTCLVVDGLDAWMAGPATDGNAAFLWVHDGGTPGAKGDSAATWIADTDETLADMEALCEAKATTFKRDMKGFELNPVVSGSLTIHPAR